MEVYSVIETLKDIVESSTSLPLTGKIMVDKEEVLELIGEILKNLPKDLKEAKSIVNERDVIIGKAQKKADEILSDLDKAMSIYIKEHDITKKAYKQANDIVTSAEKNAKEIRTGTREYAEGILVKLQDILKDTINVLQSNCEELRN